MAVHKRMHREKMRLATVPLIGEIEMYEIYDAAKERFLLQNRDESMAEAFAKTIVYLCQHPKDASWLQGLSPESPHYIDRMVTRFIKGRKIEPSIPKTVTDSMIGEVLLSFYKIQHDKIDDALNSHRQAMSAENVIGSLLEAYLASVLEPSGWAWCSGSFVKAVDFIKPDAKMEHWDLLQIKNRDNSENSSSAAIRSGTSIKKWFRSFSKTGATNWGRFPDEQLRPQLSEAGFHKFISERFF